MFVEMLSTRDGKERGCRLCPPVLERLQQKHKDFREKARGFFWWAASGKSPHPLLCSPWEASADPPRVFSIPWFREKQPFPQPASPGCRGDPLPLSALMGFSLKSSKYHQQQEQHCLCRLPLHPRCCSCLSFPSLWQEKRRQNAELWTSEMV